MYREAEFEEACNECGQAASVRCARCGDPCCAKHVYSDDNTCAECESEFLKIPEPKPSAASGLLMIGGGYAVLFVMIALIGLNVVSGVVAGVAMGGMLGMRHLGGKKRRQAYLVERRQLFLAASADRQPPSKS